MNGYFEEDGTYNEHGPALPRGRSQAETEWWESLSEGHREVIKWWNGKFGSHAGCRIIRLQKFARLMGVTANLKGPALHELAFEHFDVFKAFCEAGA